MELSSIKEHEYNSCLRDRQAITQEPESVDIWSQDRLVDVERSLAQAERLYVINVTPTIDLLSCKRAQELNKHYGDSVSATANNCLNMSIQSVSDVVHGIRTPKLFKS